jgi:rhamnose transport system ATP-binding protein
LVGENGAGKSTLLRIVAGAAVPDAGTVEIGGVPVEAFDPLAARARGVAVVYQQPALFPDLTVAENIALALEPPGPWRRVRWRDRYARAKTLLARVGAAIAPAAEARTLTMPEQQLVEVAKAIGADAKIVILDEPTASLGDREVENLFRVIKDLTAKSVGVVYVSHRLDELPRIADRVTALRDGAVVGTRPTASTSRADLIRLMVGRDVAAVYPKKVVPIGDVVLDVRNLTSKAVGVRDVSLSVRSGEIVGLAGLVGAGRTELARVLFGLAPSDGGEIRLNGKAVRVDSPAAAAALGLAYVPEDRRKHGVIADLSVSVNMTLAVLRTVAWHGFLDAGKEESLADDLVRRLGVKAESVHDPVGTLSGGNQQKVSLARWLAADPKVLILDEPTQGVDVGAKAEIHALMGDLAAKGLAILMISSELPEILGLADRVLVMHGGTITGELDRADATQERILDLALGHRKAVPA